MTAKTTKEFYPALRPLSYGKARVWELDLIRGILLILVTLDHTCSFMPLFVAPKNVVGEWLLSVARKYCLSDTRDAFQPIVILIFAFLSGISCAFSESNRMRAYKMLTFSLAFWAGYRILGLCGLPVRGVFIWNIIPVLTVCVFAQTICERYNCPQSGFFIIGVAATIVGLAFMLFSVFEPQWLLPEGIKELSLLVQNRRGAELSPDNYEPLLLPLGLFFFGSAYSTSAYPLRVSLFAKNPPRGTHLLLWGGKRSIWVYLFGAISVLTFLWLLNVIGAI